MPEGLNLDMAIKSTEGNIEFLHSLLLGMIEEHESQALALQQCHADGDTAGIKYVK